MAGGNEYLFNKLQNQNTNSHENKILHSNTNYRDGD